MAPKKTWRWWVVAAMVTTGSATPASRETQLDTARSRVVIEVGKGGALAFVAGHSHRIEAPVRGNLALDSEHPERSVASFEVRASELMVMGDGEPPQDVPKVQQTMVSERVLDVNRYPAVAFHSRAIEVRHRSGEELTLMVSGDLTLHGTTRPITVPVQAAIASDTVSARGTFTVKQTDYGMTPVTVAGGMVAVKDDVKIHFTIVAPRAVRSAGL
jgi:polyisoprenoid-binding protein YceI